MLAIISLRLSALDPDSDSFESNFVVLLLALVGSFITLLLVLEASSFLNSESFIGDVPSDLGALLSVRCGVLAADETWALTAPAVLLGVFFFCLLFRAKVSRVSFDGGSIAPLGRRPG